MRDVVAGIDIGGTWTKACLLANGSKLSDIVLATDVSSRDGLGELTLSVLNDLMADNHVDLEDLSGVGIGVPGQVHGGQVSNATNLGIDEGGFDLGRFVSAATHIPTIVENDMSVAAYGAYTQYARLDPDLANLVYIGIGTGVAAGVVVDGSIYSGSHGLAGEFGHVPVGTGLVCTCGSVGCLETVLGTGGLRQAWPGPDAGALFEAASRNDGAAQQIAGRIIDSLAMAMWWLAAAYDPDLFVIGGGVGANTPQISVMLAAKWQELAAPSALARRVLDANRIRLYDLDEPVGALGAAWLVDAQSRPRKRKEAAKREEESIP